MLKYTIYILFLFLVYGCAPITKHHGYMMDDMLYATEDIIKIETNKSHKNDVFKALGSPSIKIGDVDNVWIYLVSVKQENVFQDDEINFQQILRYQFDNDGNVTNFKTLDQNNFSKIEFSNEKTTIHRDAYGISDQIYDAFTRGTAE